MSDRKHSSIPGFVMERPVPAPAGGEVVLIDSSLVAGTPGEFEERWMIEHFPSGRVAFFANEKRARAALKALSEGRDEWDLLQGEPVPALVPQATPESPVENGFVVENTDPDEDPAESFKTLARRRAIYSRDSIIRGMWEIATDAVSHHNGEAVIDYKTRLSALTNIARYEFGDPGAKAEDAAVAGGSDPAAFRERYAKIEWGPAILEILSREGSMQELLPVLAELAKAQEEKGK